MCYYDKSDACGCAGRSTNILFPHKITDIQLQELKNSDKQEALEKLEKIGIK